MPSGLNYESVLYKKGRYLFCLAINTNDLRGTLKAITEVFLDAEITQLYSSVDKNPDVKPFRILVFGYFGESFTPGNETKYYNEMQKYALSNSKEDLCIDINQDFIIKDKLYPIMQLRGTTLKRATFISGDWFNRFLNDLAYKIGNRDNVIGNAIANAGMYQGIRIAQEIISFYCYNKIETTNKQVDFVKLKKECGILRPSKTSLLGIEQNIKLKDILTRLMKSYGQAEIVEIKDITNNGNVVGYKFVLSSHPYVYNDSCDDRVYVVKKASKEYRRRNCFYLRDVFKGIVEYLNEEINEKEAVPDESKYKAMEYYYLENGLNIFESENVGNLEGRYDTFTEENRVDICKHLCNSPNCTFYIFTKSFLHG
jgi:hypothetical protein